MSRSLRRAHALLRHVTATATVPAARAEAAEDELDRLVADAERARLAEQKRALLAERYKGGFACVC